MWKRSITLLVVASIAAGAVVGCGGDDDNGDEGTTSGTTAESTTPAPTATGKVTIKMGDFFFDPKAVTTKAGTVTISAPNVGQVEHELVLIKSDADPADLPVSGNEVDEAALEQQGGELAGELEDVQPGQDPEKAFELTPGNYVMFCNLPAHYQQGMYGSVTVK